MNILPTGVSNIENKHTCLDHRILLVGTMTLALREKRPNTEFFLVRIFPHSG